VLAIEGLRIQAHFGSASTYPNAGLGGLSGTALTAGDELPVKARSSKAQSSDDPHLCLPVFTFPGEVDTKNLFTVCAVPGPQDDYFTPDVVNSFFQNPYTLSQDVDRMGARLSGHALTHKSTEMHDLVSDAIVPGSVQVPGAGLPIVMLMDAHTVGGYPKIATVLSADLSLFSLYRPGHALRFKKVDNETALNHTRMVEKLIQSHLEKLSPLVGDDLSSERLLGLNLVSGVTDAHH